MHTTGMRDRDGKIWNFHHDGDYPTDSDVLITAPREALAYVEDGPGGDMLARITIPMQVLLDFVAEKVRSDAIIKLESADTDWLLRMFD